METKKFAAWNTSKRAQIRSFLEVEGIDDPRIGDWPAFDPRQQPSPGRPQL